MSDRAQSGLKSSTRRSCARNMRRGAFYPSKEASWTFSVGYHTAARRSGQARTLGDSGESCQRPYVCALHVVSPRGRWSCAFPRWQSNVNVSKVSQKREVRHRPRTPTRYGNLPRCLANGMWLHFAVTLVSSCGETKDSSLARCSRKRCHSLVASQAAVHQPMS